MTLPVACSPAAAKHLLRDSLNLATLERLPHAKLLQHPAGRFVAAQPSNSCHLFRVPHLLETVPKPCACGVERPRRLTASRGVQITCTGCTEAHQAACARRHKLETSQSQLTYTLDKGEYAGSAAIDSRGAGLLTATRCPS